MNESSPDRKRPLWVRLVIVRSCPRRVAILKCWLTIPVAISFILSSVFGFCWYYKPTAAQQADPRFWLALGLFISVLLLGGGLGVACHYFAVRWMDRNQQW